MKRFAVAAILLSMATAPSALQDQDTVIWAASWEEAVKEATARNVPIHVTLHKDN